MTVTELKKECKRLSIKGYSRMRKHELEQAIDAELSYRATHSPGHILTGAELMKKLPAEENLDSIAAVDREDPRPLVRRELPKGKGRPFMGRRGCCLECGSLEIQISGTDDWCAECGSGELTFKSDFEHRLLNARMAVDQALFCERGEFQANYLVALAACEQLLKVRRVRERRKVS